MTKLHTGDVELQQPKPRLQSGTGEAKIEKMEVDAEPRISAEGSRAVRVEKPYTEDSEAMKEWVANVSFSREFITIRVDESTDENAERFVEVWNNGDYQRFERGAETTCERRFVESLCRAKPISYRQRPVLDELGKPGAYQEIPHRALRYPFSVTEDKSRHAREWLKNVMSQL